MNNKKAKIIIAILIFIFLGLIIFAFASPNDEEGENLDNRVKQGEVDKKPSKETENKTDSEDETEKERNTEKEAQAKDDSYDKAKALVETAEKSLTKEDVEAAKKAIEEVTKGTDTKELEDRIAAVESDLNAKDLVDALAKLVEEAENKDGIGAASEFNTENEVEAAVEAVNNEELKTELEEALEEILNVLNDETAPKVNVEAKATKEDVTIDVEDDTEVTIKLNDEVVENGTEVTEEGKYTLTVTDEAFNETVVEFVIDKTNPEVNGVEEGQITDTEVNVVVEDDTKVTATLDGVEFDLEETITDGIHTLVVTDEAGNTTTVNFTVDTTEPTINGVEDESYVNTDVTIEVEDLTEVTATLDEEEFDLTNPITTEGKHTLVVTDAAGNSSMVTFTIDKTAPVIKIKDTVGTNGVYSYIDYKITDNIGMTKAVLNDSYSTNKEGTSRSLNFKDFGSRYIQGENTWVVYDKAGNYSTVTFNFDSIAPTLNTSAYSVTGKEGLIIYVTDDDTINVTGFISEKLQHTPKMTFTVDDTSYELVDAQLSGANIGNAYWFIASATLEDTIDLKNGNLIITLSDIVDLAGNKTESITIEYKDGEAIIVDREKPVITVKGSSIGDSERKIYSSIDLQFSDDVQVAKIITNGKEVKRTPDKGMSQNFESYKGLYVEGLNTVAIYDAAGNETTYEFTLDTTAPEITLKDDSVGSHDVYTKPNFKLYDNVGIAKVVVNETNEFAQSFSNWGDFNYGNYINYVEGNNTVTLYDAAGNKITYTVYIDMTAPYFEVKPESIGDASHKVFSHLDLKLVDDKGIVKVSVNGHDMERSFNQYGDLNHDNAGYVEGENTVVLTDAAGNTATYTFTLDLTAPEITIKDNTKKVNDVYGKPDFKLYDNVGIAKVVVNETNEFAQLFGNWGDFNYGEYINYKTGTNTVTLYDAAGNKTTLTIKLDLTAPTMTIKNSSVGNDGTYSRIDINLYDENGVANAYVNGKKYDRSGKWADLNNGNVSNYVQGENTVELYDTLGNKATLTFNYDNIAAIATATRVPEEAPVVNPFDPTPIEFTTTIEFNEAVKLTNVKFEYGDYTYDQTAVEKAGNEEYSTKYTFNATYNLYASAGTANSAPAELTFQDFAGNKTVVSTCGESNPIMVEYLPVS